MPQHRQLSAIQFTDIEGYMAIMQHNEQSAMIIKDRQREILHRIGFLTDLIPKLNYEEKNIFDIISAYAAKQLRAVHRQ